jgi:methylglutaconyl-CoA hydratase
MSQNLSITQSGAVARITLTQPEIRNAFSDEVIAEITAAFVDVGSRADVRAVVLAAEGPAFCAGANLNWMRRMADYTRDENIADAGKLAEMLRVIYECPKPTIARVQGDVYAGGMGLVAACDMAVAVDTAGFCLSEVKLGLIPATISPYVIRAMGARAAHRYFLTAERFGAPRRCASALCTRWWLPTSSTPRWTNCSRPSPAPAPTPCAPARSWCMDVAEREINAGLIAATVQGIADIRASDEGKEGVQSFLQQAQARVVAGLSSRPLLGACA